MEQAFYRKYRPRKLADVLGQDINVSILKNAAKNNKIGQAYIFSGPRGTGKTTTARLLAKLINCEKRNNDPEFAKLGEPCNECNQCREIDAQNSFDVIEIDAASNRGIDEIRNLKENIATSPTTAKHKIYIIDEAHMLTTAAFNALLKVFEEPPAHAVIILATTEFEKLPKTITSRAQRFSFKKLGKIDIMNKLKEEAKKENIKIDDSAIELIAEAGEGSLRDAESLLEQTSSFGEKIDSSVVELITGKIGIERINAFAEAIIKKDTQECLSQISKLNNEGKNIIVFTKDLIHYFRKILSIKIDESLKENFKNELTNEEITGLEKLAKMTTEAFLTKIMSSLIKAYSEMRYSPFSAIPLEIMLVENLSEGSKKS
jgi:DNA polymerase-3 subunit gamma/tau